MRLDYGKTLQLYYFHLKSFYLPFQVWYFLDKIFCSETEWTRTNYTFKHNYTTLYGFGLANDQKNGLLADRLLYLWFLPHTIYFIYMLYTGTRTQKNGKYRRKEKESNI